MHQYAARIRDAVGRQFHDERDRIAPKQRPFEQQSAQDRHQYADQIDRQHDDRGVMGKESRGDHAIDRQLGTARHERRQDDGHLAVALTAQGPRRHDGRYAAAKADQHRHEALAGKTDLAQRLIHDVGDPRHVAAVLQQAEEEKQDNDQRQEREHAADAGTDAIDDQRMQPRRDLPYIHLRIEPADEHIDAAFQQALQSAADRHEGQIKDQQHDPQKDRNAQIFMRQPAVDLFAALLLTRFIVMSHTLCDQ